MRLIVFRGPLSPDSWEIRGASGSAASARDPQKSIAKCKIYTRQDHHYSTQQITITNFKRLWWTVGAQTLKFVAHVYSAPLIISPWAAMPRIRPVQLGCVVCVLERFWDGPSLLRQTAPNRWWAVRKCGSYVPILVSTLGNKVSGLS